MDQDELNLEELEQVTAGLTGSAFADKKEELLQQKQELQRMRDGILEEQDKEQTEGMSR